ncbi:hypothetical protein D3C80_1600120 [compost metagenome]
MDFLVGVQRNVGDPVVQFDRHAALGEFLHRAGQCGFQAGLFEAEAEGGEQFAELAVGAVQPLAQLIEGGVDAFRRSVALAQHA